MLVAADMWMHGGLSCLHAGLLGAEVSNIMHGILGN
jgi:hypothetical protein